MNSMTVLFVIGLCVMVFEIFIILKQQLQEPNKKIRERLTQLEKESQELE